MLLFKIKSMSNNSTVLIKKPLDVVKELHRMFLSNLPLSFRPESLLHGSRVEY